METLRRNWPQILAMLAIAAMWGGSQATLGSHQRQIDKLELRQQYLERIPVMEAKIDSLKEALDEHKKTTQKP